MSAGATSQKKRGEIRHALVAPCDERGHACVANVAKISVLFATKLATFATKSEFLRRNSIQKRETQNGGARTLRTGGPKARSLVTTSHATNSYVVLHKLLQNGCNPEVILISGLSLN